MKRIFIGKGQVGHSRHESAENSFRYSAFFLFFNCADEESLWALLKTRFHRGLSLRSEDYLDGHAGALLTCAQNFLRDRCGGYEADEIWLHTLPRMFGYAFNPVSFWFCYKNGQIDAILVEVNNTFGERHFYWLNDAEKLRSNSWLRAEKVFHVSPFMPVNGYYEFLFRLSEKNASITINYYDEKSRLRLATWVSGDLSPLVAESILSLLWSYGWLTPLVILRIHFQALRLWFKKVRFFRKPKPPEQKVT